MPKLIGYANPMYTVAYVEPNLHVCPVITTTMSVSGGHGHCRSTSELSASFVR